VRKYHEIQQEKANGTPAKHTVKTDGVKIKTADPLKHWKSFVKKNVTKFDGDHTARSKIKQCILEFQHKLNEK
jgi:hypothetical protein